jgi:hypothetical protein
MLSRHFSFTITKSKRFVCSSIRRSFQHTRIPFFNQLSFYASVPVQQKLPKNSLKTDVQKDDKMIEDPKHRNVKNLQSSENKIKSSSDKQKTPKNKEEKRTIQRKTENKKSSLKERSKTDSLQQPEVEKNDQLSHKKTLQQSKKKNTVPPSQQKGKTLPTVTTATTDPSEQTQNLKSKRKIADEKDFDFLAPLEETNRSFMDTNPETFQNHWQNVEYFSRTYLGLTFNNWELFQRALTHKSYINVPILHNESLAILGSYTNSLPLNHSLTPSFISLSELRNTIYSSSVLILQRFNCCCREGNPFILFVRLFCFNGKRFQRSDTTKKFPFQAFSLR